MRDRDAPESPVDQGLGPEKIERSNESNCERTDRQAIEASEDDGMNVRPI